MSKEINITCPCCSKKQYTICCQPLHLGIQPAQSPEQLMRSRYAAFAKTEVDYLIKTSHSSIRPGFTKASIKQWAIENDWQKLEVIRASENGTNGLVEFKAYFKSAQGKNEFHHELSGFVKEKNLWYYKTGEIMN